MNPKRLDAAVDKNFAYWHSASFNNDGTKVIFTDEWGGGTSPRCRATDLLTWGANAIFNVVDKKLVFGGYYKMPAPQTDQENCVAHNGSLVPVPGRDIMVQAWYQGGLSMFDFTDAAHPVEIAYFDRGPIDPTSVLIGGYWSTYYYNGHIYGSEIYRGLDIFKLVPTDQLTQNEIDAAALVKFDRAQRAASAENHLAAELRGGQGLSGSARPQQDDRRRRARTACDADGSRREGDRARRRPRAGRSRLRGSQLETDAAKATGVDAKRMKGAAEAMKGRAAQLK